MAHNFFGYEPPTLPSYVAQYDDYMVGRSTNFEPSDWDNLDKINIITLWESIKNESDEEARGVVEMWRRVETLLDSARSALEQHALALRQRWNSPAGEEFLRRIGAALYSFEEWRAAAAANKTTMDTVADQIAAKQTAMRELWGDYVGADADAARRRHEERTDSVLMSIGRGFTEDPPSYREVLEDYTNQAKPIMRDLADTYVNSSFNLERGSVYKGPTVASDPVADINPSGGRGGPGGGGPAIPTMTAPTLPFPGLPPRQVPQGPELAGVATLPPPPTMPTTPTAPIGIPGPGGLGGLPGFAALPGLPGTPGRPGVRGQPGMPDRPAGGGAPRPTSPNVPGQRGRPTLPGTSARSGAPGSPGSPGRPNLRGSSARATGQAQSAPPGGGGRVPPGMRGRPSGQAAPPPLTGRRGASAGPTEPRLPGTGGTPRAGGSSPLSGRRASEPGTTPPRRTLGRGTPGRALGASSTPHATPPGQSPGGPRARLGGRRQPDRSSGGPGAGAAARRRGKQAEERTHGTDLTSDENLWAVESAAAQLDTPPAPPPPKPGPAIGKDA